MTDGKAPVIWWVRRDLRLADNPCLVAALASGRPVIPVFILDPETESVGAAPLWRWGLGLVAFAKALEAIGGRLILRHGPALETLRAVIRDTGATRVTWSRLYDPDSVRRDTAVKAALKEEGTEVASHPGHVLFEPWTVTTKTAGYYKVYTPFWKAVRDLDPGLPAAPPGRWPAPEHWPDSSDITGWRMGARMRRGAAVMAPHQLVGEAAAAERLDAFLDDAVEHYREERDFPGRDATSRLSAPLAYGEIGVRRIWAAGWRALEQGRSGAETFLKELVWRDFAYHLIHHTPGIVTRTWRPEWDGFPWHVQETAAARAWKQGRTGVPFVDAAMREMYVTGTMHNRARMSVASYLTKHLMTHWHQGQRWFADCLTDWDPASNAMGWQWTAGSGPDASPFFRIFNPVTQAEKFDPNRVYRDRWIAEGRSDPAPEALSYFDAVPESWGLSPGDAYPRPVVELDAGRRAALAAYEQRRG